MLFIDEVTGQELTSEELGLNKEVDLTTIVKLKSKGVIVKFTDSEINKICKCTHYSYLIYENDLKVIYKTGNSIKEVMFPLKDYEGSHESGYGFGSDIDGIGPFTAFMISEV